MKSGFYLSFVRHTRFIPKAYSFDFRFFWTRLNLDELDELQKRTFFFSRNSFNLFSFYDRDHIHLGKPTLRENIQTYLEEEGVFEEIKKVVLVTQPRILGYTFNPVSFYLIDTEKNSYLVIEIGNTFKEQKPYLVLPEHRKEGKWIFTTKKYFYISPFASVENSMTFNVQSKDEDLSIVIDDHNLHGELELRTSYRGKWIPWSSKNLFSLLMSYPFLTLRIITSIHYHALRLYLKKIPYFKKTDELGKQTDLYVLKDKYFLKKS